MKKIIFFILNVPLLVTGQDVGVHFEKGLSWSKIIEKATTENKYILVDCFTSWCGPCKSMEKDIYPLRQVGEYINANFISIKLQIDSTKEDNSEVQAHYDDAHYFQKNFKINGYPCFLFFSPNGRILHKGLGYKTDSGFIAMAADALNVKRQYYTLLYKYQHGEKVLSNMKYLASSAYSFGDKVIARAIAEEYVRDLKDNELFLKDNISFIREFLTESKSRGFNMFYKCSKKVDQVMSEPGYSQDVVDYIIAKEEIDPKLWPRQDLNVTVKPNWDMMRLRIGHKYNLEYADRTIMGAMIRWYAFKREWSSYSQSLIDRVEKYGAFGIINLSDWRLNFDAWEIFLHCTDTVGLLKALAWSDSAIKMSNKPNPSYYDTYANLLYKLGRKDEAINWEQNAAALDPGAADLKDTLAKMKTGKSTWTN